MSDQEQSVSEPTTECSICGHVPGPFPECDTCGGNRTFIKPRAFTRTEEIRGQQTDPERYSRTGNVAPKVLNLPGSFNPADPGPRS